MGPVVGGRTGDDTIEVVGEPLRFHQSFAAAVGTADEVAAGGCAAVEGLHDGAGLQCGFVNRAVTEIDQLLGMTDGPFKSRVDMSRIGSRGYIAPLHDIGKPAAGERTYKSGISCCQKFPIPIGCVGKPHFNADMRVARRRRIGLDSAE